MKAIRGATTIERDNAEQVKVRVKELLDAIFKVNELTREDAVCIIFSSTKDVRSFYPAKAAREAGYSSCALFSAEEPDIKGALKRCIRVMMLTEKEITPKHVYLHGAAMLRQDLTKIINIAIDGPAGSGKSTVSKMVASKLGILHLDTGAMYRAFALKCFNEGADTSDEEAIEKIISATDIQVKYENGVQHTYLDCNDVSESIRKPEISLLASTVSALKCVREKMVEQQRKTAESMSCVIDGRDIGTHVLPQTKFKFFLTATPEVRATRRAEENAAKGFNQAYEDVLSEIIKRDEQDKTRKISPLTQAEDAVFVDSSEMNAEEVAQFILNKVQEKI